MKRGQSVRGLERGKYQTEGDRRGSLYFSSIIIEWPSKGRNYAGKADYAESRWLRKSKEATAFLSVFFSPSSSLCPRLESRYTAGESLFARACSRKKRESIFHIIYIYMCICLYKFVYVYFSIRSECKTAPVLELSLYNTPIRKRSNV
jgi:hypothetical protein